MGSGRSFLCDNCKTRQLPIGAGHCQWGGLTDRNICNTHGGEHLASRYWKSGPWAHWLQREGALHTPGRKARKYIMMICQKLWSIPKQCLCDYLHMHLIVETQTNTWERHSFVPNFEVIALRCTQQAEPLMSTAARQESTNKQMILITIISVWEK